MLKSDLIETLLNKDKEQLENSNHNLKFYHADLSIDESEVKLLDFKLNSNIKSNVFLLRNRLNEKNFILSVLESNGFMHYAITHIEDCYFKVSNDLIHGLEELINKFNIQHFVSGQAPPNWSLKFGVTQLLHKVVQNEYFNLLFQVLMNPKCTQINEKNSFGRTALHEACLKGSQMVDVLLKSGASIYIRDSNGNSPLHICCSQGFDYLLELLIYDYDSNINDRNPQTGQTPLHQAAINNKPQIIKALVKKYGVLLNLKTNSKETLLDLAKKSNSTDAVKIIESLLKEQLFHGSHEDWYHENTTDKEAIEILDSAGKKDSLFLVIKSETRINNFNLLFYYDKKLVNYEINYSKNGFKIDQTYKNFSSLESMVYYYRNNSTTIGCILTSSINKNRKIINFSNASLKPNLERFKRSESLKIKSNNFERNRASLRLTNAMSINKIMSYKKNLNHFDKQNISMYDIEIKYKIGEGEYGNVYRGNFFDQTGNCIPVAVKQLKHNEKQKDFLRESKIISSLNHDCIVKFHGFCSETKMILLELIFMGSLNSYLKTNYSQITIDLIKLWCIQIADGMRYLESINIIHRDLASRNILLKALNQIKITDFGMARKLMPNEVYCQDSTQKIPFKWYPLESIESNIFTSKSDVWSYGITIWEIFSFGMNPYENLTLNQVVYTLKRGSRLLCPYNCSQNWYKLMLQCWNIHPLNRPSFEFIFYYLNNEYRLSPYK